MSAPTPGQLAYEAWHRTRFPADPPAGWIHPATSQARPAWQAAAEAGHDALVAELTQMRYERDQAIGVNDNLRTQLAELREACERQRLEVLQARGEKDDHAARADKLRAHLTEVLDWFHGTGDGFRARVSGVRLTREYTRAGLPVPDRLSHLAGQ